MSAMRCTIARHRLTAGVHGAPPPADLASHLAACPTCGAFAARLDAARSALASVPTPVEPDPAFARRVAARLAQTRPSPSDDLGWAALRLLPAALALVVILAGWGLATSPSPVELLADQPEADALSWALGDGEAAP